MSGTLCKWHRSGEDEMRGLMRSAIVGVLAVTERLSKEAEQESTSMFFAQLFERQLVRQRAVLDAFAVSVHGCRGRGQ